MTQGSTEFRFPPRLQCILAGALRPVVLTNRRHSTKGMSERVHVVPHICGSTFSRCLLFLYFS